MSIAERFKSPVISKKTRALAVNLIMSYIEKGGELGGSGEAPHGFDAPEYGLGSIVRFNSHSIISKAQQPDSPDYHHAVMPVDILHTVTPMIGVVALIEAERSFIGFNISKGFRKNSTAFLIEHGGVQAVDTVPNLNTLHITFFDEPEIVRRVVLGQPSPISNR
ncbi:MAG: hypothetical protein AAB914_02600 [Patescibacteria group bacterium]